MGRSQNDSPTFYLVQALIYVGCTILILTIGPKSPADRPAFDASSSCNAQRLFSTNAGSAAGQAALGPCVVENVTVEGKDSKVLLSHGGRILYWASVVASDGNRHRLAIPKDAYESIAVGQALKALVYNQHVTTLAIGGRAVQTDENPDTLARGNVYKWIGSVVLLLLAAFYLYQAWKTFRRRATSVATS